MKSISTTANGVNPAETGSKENARPSHAENAAHSLEDVRRDLTPAELKREDELWNLRADAELKLRELSLAVKEAVKVKNAQARLVKKLSLEWVGLAERKYDTRIRIRPIS